MIRMQRSCGSHPALRYMHGVRGFADGSWTCAMIYRWPGTSLVQFSYEMMPSDVHRIFTQRINSEGCEPASPALRFYTILSRTLYARMHEIVEHLGSILGCPGRVHLLPQEYEGIGDADTDNRGAKANTQ